MFPSGAAALGGLGIFFFGMFQLKDNLKKLTSRRFKLLIGRFTRSAPAGLAMGLCAGAVMQSTTAVTFIVANMVASGLVIVTAALPVVIGANIGSTLIVLVATIDTQLFVLLVLGVAGLSFAFERLAGLRTFAGAMFGVGLVLFGLQMLKSGVLPLTREPWFAEALAQATAFPLVPLLGAAALTMLAQSSNSVILLTIALAAAGGLGTEQAMLAIYGCNLGSSGQSFMLSGHLTGRPKQVAMFQALFNIQAALLMLLLHAVETGAGVPLVRALAARLAEGVAAQLALIQLLFNLAGAILALALLPWLARGLAGRFPPPADEAEGQPVFVHHQPITDPESELDLAGMEQRRLAALLPLHLETARSRPREALAVVARRDGNVVALAEEIAGFLRRLGDEPFGVSGYDRLNRAINRQRLLDGLNETLVELARTALQAQENALLLALVGNVIEGLDATLLTMVDALGDPAGDDGALFYAITRNRGEVVQKLRQSYLAYDDQLSTAQKGAILVVTNLAERALWLLGQIAEQEQDGLEGEERHAVLSVG